MAQTPLGSILKGIYETKEPPTEEVLRGYPPFVINKCISFHPELVFYANEMNALPDIPKEFQYTFYAESFPSRKRFAPWKKRSIEDHDLKKFFCEMENISIQKLESVWDMIPDETKQRMKKEMKIRSQK